MNLMEKYPLGQEETRSGKTHPLSFQVPVQLKEKAKRPPEKADWAERMAERAAERPPEKADREERMAERAAERAAEGAALIATDQAMQPYPIDLSSQITDPQFHHNSVIYFFGQKLNYILRIYPKDTQIETNFW